MRPIVVLPRDAGEWSLERARIVLCHELAHVRRADWLVLLAAELLRAAYWFNPLTWMIGKRLRDESERACDDEVMNQGVEGTTYATELLALARILNAERPGWVAAPAMARPSSLERRVTAMVNHQINRQPVGRAPRVLILATALRVCRRGRRLYRRGADIRVVQRFGGRSDRQCRDRRHAVDDQQEDGTEISGEQQRHRIV